MFYFPTHRIGNEESAGTVSQTTEAMPVSQAIGDDFQNVIEGTRWELQGNEPEQAPADSSGQAPAGFVRAPPPVASAPSGAQSSQQSVFPKDTMGTIDETVKNSKATSVSLSKMIERITKATMSDIQSRALLQN